MVLRKSDDGLVVPPFHNRKTHLQHARSELFSTVGVACSGLRSPSCFFAFFCARSLLYCFPWRRELRDAAHASHQKGLATKLDIFRSTRAQSCMNRREHGQRTVGATTPRPPSMDASEPSAARKGRMYNGVVAECSTILLSSTASSSLLRNNSSFRVALRSLPACRHPSHLLCPPGPPNEIGVLLLKIAWALYDEHGERHERP